MSFMSGASPVMSDLGTWNFQFAPLVRIARSETPGRPDAPGEVVN
ncbi:hypothetical protein [Streptomyces sp. AcH 505]